MTWDIKHRSGTSAQWAASGRILQAGEIGYDTTLKIAKMGDGTTSWANLPVHVGDTGERNIASLIQSPAVDSGSRLRRIGSLIYLYISISSFTGWVSGDALLTLPVGFRPPTDRGLNWPYTSSAFAVWVYAATGEVEVNTAGAASARHLGDVWPTNDAWPTSYPGAAA